MSPLCKLHRWAINEPLFWGFPKGGTNTRNNTCMLRILILISIGSFEFTLSLTSQTAYFCNVANLCIHSVTTDNSFDIWLLFHMESVTSFFLTSSYSYVQTVVEWQMIKAPDLFLKCGPCTKYYKNYMSGNSSLWILTCKVNSNIFRWPDFKSHRQ